VANTYHFAYADGTPYNEAGTTCYNWVHQNDELQKATLAELDKGFFNKMRLCVLPKHMVYNLHDPVSFPFEGTPMDPSVLTMGNAEYYGSQYLWWKTHNDAALSAFMQGVFTMRKTHEKDILKGASVLDTNHFDYNRFNPLHFQRVEAAIAALQERGIEADLIVMHPYDRWDFSTMTPDQDNRYWRYCIARFAAYRNVWWSLANEYDMIPQKSEADWERYASILVNEDPYQRLRSIHQCFTFYDHSRPWVTHCSVQGATVEKAAEWRAKYGKPVVFDEMTYEGNTEYDWGNITGQELLRRFWVAALRGGYGGHGETFTGKPFGPLQEALWWSHGGPLHGDSPARIKFLRRILDEAPEQGLKQYVEFDFTKAFGFEEYAACADTTEAASDYYICYFGLHRPVAREFDLPFGAAYEVDVIDTWDMTIEPLGAMKGHITVPLPGKEYMAVRIRKAA
jgi:hypothetical protein